MSRILPIRKVPLFRLIIPFIIGICGASFFSSFFIQQSKLLFCLMLFSGSLVFFLYLLKQSRFFFELLLYIFLLLFGTVTALQRINIPDFPEASGNYFATVYSLPQVKTKSILIPVKFKNQQRDNFLEPHSTKINLYTKKDSSLLNNLKVGDQLIVKTTLKKIRNNGNPYEFNFKRFMLNRGVTHSAFSSESSIVNLGCKGNMPLRRFSANIQSIIIEKFQSDEFSIEARALLIALASGNKDFISDETRISFANSGAVHVLAVSGLHVGIIYLILNFLLTFMERSKKLRWSKTVIVILVIWIYALITGLSPSVTRAALMFSMINVGKALNRDISFFNILAGAAFIMLVINPLSLFEVGFQLSFIAVGGIVYFQPKFYSLFSFDNWLADNIYKLFTVSLSAQLVTAPLTMYYFHQFPTYFWLTNILIIPLVFGLVFLAVFYLSISSIPFLSIAVGKILNLLAEFTSGWVRLVDSLPGSVIENISFGVLSLVLLYLLLYAITTFFNRKKYFFLVGSLFLIIGLLIQNIVFVNTRNNLREFVVYNTPGSTTIGAYNAINSFIIVDADHAARKSRSIYSAQNHLVKYGIQDNVEIVDLDSICPAIEKLDNIVHLPKLCFSDKNIVFYSGNKFGKTTDPITAEAVVICGNVFPPEEEFKCSYLIVDGSVSRKLSSYWRNYALEFGINFYDTKEKGAFLF